MSFSLAILLVSMVCSVLTSVAFTRDFGENDKFFKITALAIDVFIVASFLYTTYYLMK